MKKIQAIICDLDGTLADCEHRVHHIKQDKPDWEAFHQDCGRDKVIEPIAHLVRMYDHYGFHVIICTGRMFKSFEKTRSWLDFNVIPFHRIHMRPNDDFRHDYELKQSMLDEIQERYEIFVILEDRDRVVQMYRDNGLACLQVADGAY